MTKSIKEIIENDVNDSSSLSIAARKLLSVNRLSMEQLDRMVDEWTTTPPSPEKIERVRKRNIALIKKSGGGISIFNVKEIYRLYKTINPAQVDVNVAYLGYVVNIKLVKGKLLPCIRLAKCLDKGDL